PCWTCGSAACASPPSSRGRWRRASTTARSARPTPGRSSPRTARRRCSTSTACRAGRCPARSRSGRRSRPAAEHVDLYRLARPALFRLDPERAHELTLQGLRLASRSRLALRASGAFARGARDPSLRVEAFGLTFPNPVGLAAGLDKDGVAVPALAALGFGYLEVGTVTALAQPWNPRPRLFRLVEDGALVNRMGFNNRGAERLAASVLR